MCVWEVMAGDSEDANGGSWERQDVPDPLRRIQEVLVMVNVRAAGEELSFLVLILLRITLWISMYRTAYRLDSPRRRFLDVISTWCNSLISKPISLQANMRSVAMGRARPELFA